MIKKQATKRPNWAGDSKIARESGLVHICPRCGKHYVGEGALSRRDNETMICSDCGTQEALADWANRDKRFK